MFGNHQGAKKLASGRKIGWGVLQSRSKLSMHLSRLEPKPNPPHPHIFSGPFALDGLYQAEPPLEQLQPCSLTKRGKVLAMG